MSSSLGLPDTAMRGGPRAPDAEPNAILASVEGPEREAVRASAVRVRLVQDQVLVEQQTAIEHVFFLEQGIVSLAPSGSGRQAALQVGMVGPEGFIGVSALFPPGTLAMFDATVQMPGTALRLPVTLFRTMLERYPSLHAASYAHLRGRMAALAQTACCNGLHTLSQRCANWLLAAHGRSGGREFLLTHEYLARTLGVRRSGITVALSALAKDGLIAHGRGRIRVCEPAGLARLSCGCAVAARAPEPPPG